MLKGSGKARWEGGGGGRKEWSGILRVIKFKNGITPNLKFKIIS
jgi:hypothetical protein